MRTWRLLPALFVLMGGLPAAAGATPFSLRLVLHAAVRDPLPVGIRATPVANASLPPPEGGWGKPLEAHGLAPGEIPLALDPAKLWQLSLEAPGYWSPPVIVNPAAGPATAELWPQARIVGSVRVEAGETRPKELAVRFRPSLVPGKALPFSEQTVTCPVEENGAWTCTVPASRLDLRVKAKGFIAHYRWGADLPAGLPWSLGALTLQRGASVVERVEAQDGPFKPHGDWDVDVEATAPVLSRRVRKIAVEPRAGGVARLEIRLPDTRVAGEVVDEKGAKVAMARVLALELETARPMMVFAGKDGHFELAGMPPGPLTVSAETPNAQSDAVIVAVAEKNPPAPLQLVVRPRRQVEGTVAGPLGPVAGARVLAVASARGSEGFLPASAQALTDVEGKFRLSLWAQATDLQLIVLAPGHAILAQRLPGFPKEPLALLVSPHGGTLEISPGDAGDSEDPKGMKLGLFVNGVVLDAALLERWSAMNGEATSSDRLVVPAMPPTSYTACWMGLGQSVQSLKTGDLPGAPGCASGALGSGGRLSLVRPR